MNENRTRRGPGRGLLLLIPVALIIAKGASRRRAMWASEGEAGHRGQGFGAGDIDARRRGAFRMPPRLEWMLDTWHTKAHQAADEADPSTSPGPATV